MTCQTPDGVSRKLAAGCALQDGRLTLLELELPTSQAGLQERAVPCYENAHFLWSVHCSLMSDVRGTQYVSISY